MVGQTDDRDVAAIDPLLDQKTALHEQTSGFDDVLGLELVEPSLALCPGRQDARADALDDVADVAARDGQVVERGDRRSHGAAGVVAQNGNQWHSEQFGGELERSEDRRVDDVTGGAHDEHIAETLVENHLRGDARVRAAEQHDVGRLPVGEDCAVDDTLIGMIRFPCDEAFVPGLQVVPGLGGRDSC